MDFKGPVKGPRSYLLVIIDEYSRYPFVYPCKNLSSSIVIECLSSLFCTFGFPEFIHSHRGESFVSKELKPFLSDRDIATSYSSPYHPQGNGQCERANQTIWRTKKLLLRSSNLPEQEWEKVLPKALHAIRSLICRTINQTPHERLFSFSRRAMAGTGLPSWLLEEGSEVLLRRFVRDKCEPLCDVVELLMANPTYARVRRKDGKEITVSTSDLAPYPRVSPTVDVDKANTGEGESSVIDVSLASETEHDQAEESLDKTDSVEANLFREEPTIGLRRSNRIRRAQNRFR